MEENESFILVDNRSIIDDLDDITLTYLLFGVCCSCIVLLMMTALYQYIIANLQSNHKECSLSKKLKYNLDGSPSKLNQVDEEKEDTEKEIEECPLCLEEITYPVQTCCLHKFCGECLSQYLNHTSRVVPIKCPVCRHKVALFIISDKTRHSLVISKDAVVLNMIVGYNKRFSGEQRTFLDYLHDSPYILLHLILYLFSNQGLFWISIVKFLLVLSLMLLIMLSPWQLFSDDMYNYFDKLIGIFTMSFALIHVIVVVKHIILNRA